jgi:D-alanyl-D-alanine carboxypeptidase
MLRLLCLALVVLTGCGRKIWTAPDPNTLKDALTAAIDAHLAAGVAARVQTPKGEWVYVSGSAANGSDLTPSRPLDRVDRFAVRDITAAYVVTALLILVDDGTVRLADPVSKFVPAIPHGDEITLRHLAAMQSGLGDYRVGLQTDPLLATTPFELLKNVPAELHFTPGTSFEYSRTNPLLLGEVIFAVTGKPWFDFVRERMLEPVKLFRTELPGDQPSEPFAHGVDTETGERDRVHYSYYGAATGVVSTLDELSTFGRALAEGAYLSVFMQSQRLAFSDAHYGLGIAELSGLYGHSGQGDGYSAAVFHQPASDMTITVLFNHAGAVDDEAAVAVSELAAILGWTH